MDVKHMIPILSEGQIVVGATEGGSDGAAESLMEG